MAIPNYLFVKKEGSNKLDINCSKKGVVFVSRFSSTRPADIFLDIYKAALNIGNKEHEEELEELINSLPGFVSTQIKEQEGKYVDFIKTHCYLTKKLKEHLLIEYAQLPERIVEDLPCEEKLRQIIWSYSNESEDLGWKYDIALFLKEGSLPPKADIDNLIRLRLSGKTKSMELDPFKKRMPSREIKEFTDTLYNVLNTTEKINKVKDLTNRRLRSIAICTMHKLHEHLEEELAEEIMEELDTPKEIEDFNMSRIEERKRFSGWDNFSDN